MRMHRKKHLDERLERCFGRIINMQVEDKSFGANTASSQLSFSELFGNDRPVELEIGCGKGGFIMQMAEKHPEINFLAVEKYGNVLVTAAEETEKRDLPNIRYLWGDAEYLPRFIPAGSIEKLYLNFSTPFPKNRAAVHRLTHRHFLEMYRLLLKKGATVEQKTDDRGLFQFSLEEFSQSGYMIRRVSLDLHADDYPDNVVTEYEQQFIDRGMPIYRLEATS